VTTLHSVVHRMIRMEVALVGVHPMQSVMSADDDISCEKQILDIERLCCGCAVATSSHGHSQWDNDNVTYPTQTHVKGISSTPQVIVLHPSFPY